MNDNNIYININRIAELKGLTSNRSIRLAIQQGKYIARKVPVPGGETYGAVITKIVTQ